jgi:hypothetical protein
MRRSPGVDELPRSALTMFHSFGFESTKRNNIAYIAEDTLIYTVGNMAQTLDLTTLQQTYLPGRAVQVDSIKTRVETAHGFSA